MKDISNTVLRKFVDSHDTSGYEIMTDDGWVDALKIHKTIPYKIWQITTTNHTLKCADTHIVFKHGFKQVFAKDLLIGDVIITDDGLEEVEAIAQLDNSDNMYDIELANDSNHRYYTNGILSHNTTSYTIYALWTLIFHCERRIMLLANKADTALEILGRIKLAYEYLPPWLKPGIVTLNKGEIIFSNKSAIKGFATASDAARGYSANCVNKDSIIYIRSKYLKWLKIPVKIKRLKTVAKFQETLMRLAKTLTCFLKRF